jgi:rod shape determining protein RodA
LIVVFLVYVSAAGVVLGTNYVYNHLEAHQKTRIDVLLGRGTVDLKKEGYNVNQAKIAIGSGGFLGKGYLQGTQTKYDFVPEQDTDFIFCTVGEEWGFVGSTVVIFLELFLILRLIFLAERQRSDFSRIYGYGVASVLFFHLAVNIGMTIGLMPVIGIPLPFFSYGGSSLWSFTILLFIFIKLDANRLLILR